MNNPLQRQLLNHMQAVFCIPATTLRWPLLSELGVQPMQRGWWSHVIRFYNQAARRSSQRGGQQARGR